MNNVAVTIVAFACVFGGALFGVFLRPRLPQHHLTEDSKDVLKVGMALMGTMAALFLSLQLGSAKASFDEVNGETTRFSADVIVLDHTLAYYGPEAQPARELLRRNADLMLAEMWRGQAPDTRGAEATRLALLDSIQGLAPATENQQMAKAQARELAISAAQLRWLMVEQASGSVSMPMMAVLISWLTIIFISYGLFAPRNATVVCGLFASASSIAGAILLLMEFQTPFTGVIHVSDKPLRAAIALLGH